MGGVTGHNLWRHSWASCVVRGQMPMATFSETNSAWNPGLGSAFQDRKNGFGAGQMWLLQCTSPLPCLLQGIFTVCASIYCVRLASLNGLSLCMRVPFATFALNHPGLAIHAS